RCSRQMGKGSGGILVFAIQQQRLQYRLDQQCAMLGPARREIAPDLTPTVRAITILYAYKDRGTAIHRTERGTHGVFQGIAQHMHAEFGGMDTAVVSRHGSGTIRESSSFQRG